MMTNAFLDQKRDMPTVYSGMRGTSTAVLRSFFIGS
jgi:hypothetical protein